MGRYDICNMEYQAYGLNHLYGNIEAGGCTCYMNHEKAYRYPSKMSLSDYRKEFVYWAIDFVGEIQLEPGLYNYNLWSIKTKENDYLRGYMVASDEDPDYTDAINFTCDEQVPVNCGKMPDQLNLRIVNESIFQFCGITFENSHGKGTQFGTLESGMTSCYVPLKFVDKNNFRISFKVNDIDLEYTTFDSPVWQDIVEYGAYTLYVTLPSLNGERVVHVFEQDE